MQTKSHLNGKEINLTSEDITIKSNNFNVDKNGNMSCSNADITGGNVSISTTNANIPKVVVKTEDGSIYTEIRPTGIRTIYDNSLLFWVNGTATNIRNLQGKGVVFSGNALYINDDSSSSNYPISLTGSNGEITCKVLTQTSLKSKKKDIKKLNLSALDLIKNSDICLYNLDSEKTGSKQHVGLVIGEGYKCPEEVISEDGQGIEQYSMTSLAWKAIQELIEKNDSLKQRIERLEAEKDDLGR